MAMTRKDYELIAGIIKGETEYWRGVMRSNGENISRQMGALRETVSKMSVAFSAGNERFDREKFTKACGF